MAFAALLDLFRQVANVLQPAHGGTGSKHGESRVVVPGVNATGGSLPLATLVEFVGTNQDRHVQKVASANSVTVLGAIVGYYGTDGALVEADCPDGYLAAVQVVGIADVLVETAVTAGQYAFSAATAGQITSSATAAAGAFGRVVESADTSTGATTAPVALPLTASAGGGGGTFGTPALTLGTANAAGAASTGIRTDATLALFDSTAPVTQAFSDAAAAGAAAVAARRDHKHGMPASPSVPGFATPSVALGTAAAAGAAGTVIRSDSTIAAFDSTAPSTQAFGDAAAVGTAAYAARRDHKHGMPASPSSPSQGTPGLTLGTTNVAGSSGAYVGTDATIAAFDATVPAAVGTAAAGAATVAARRDHVHPTGAGTPSTQAFGDAAATGSGPAAAMSDHKHAMPALLVVGLDIVVNSPAVGDVCDIEMPYAGTFTEWTVLNDAAGSIKFDIYKAAYSAFPPSSSIVGSDNPLTTSAAKNQNASLSAWTTPFSAGDIIRVHIISTSGVNRSTLALRFTRS